MTLRKIPVDNSVKYIARKEQVQDRDIKLNTIKNSSLPRNKTKNCHKIIKHSLKII